MHNNIIISITLMLSHATTAINFTTPFLYIGINHSTRLNVKKVTHYKSSSTKITNTIGIIKTIVKIYMVLRYVQLKLTEFALQ